FLVATPRPPGSTPLSLHAALPISSASAETATSDLAHARPGIRRRAAPANRPPRRPASTSTALEGAAGSSISGFKMSADFSEAGRSEEHTSELQSRENLVCRLLLEK